MYQASPRFSAIAKLVCDHDISGAKFHWLFVYILAASAKSKNGSNDRNNDNAFQTLHGLLSSGY
jgi:hypothetical protein